MKGDDLSDALDAVIVGIRGHLGLRQALVDAGQRHRTLAGVAHRLDGGHPLIGALDDEAAASGDPDVAAALGLLAVHAEVGGDPVVAVGAVADRVRRRSASRAGARAATTQARMSSRALLALTPGFLVLLFVADPSAFSASLADPRTRAGLGLGLVLQLAGAAWMVAIVGNVTSTPRLASVPVVRAVWALLAGRSRRSAGGEVAAAADAMAFVLDAGGSAVRALGAAGRQPGLVGDVIGAILDDVDGGAGLVRAAEAACRHHPDAAVRRFGECLTTAGRLDTPLGPPLQTLADDLRKHADIELDANVKRASVRVLVPLGLLILPAFVLSCLVPLMTGGLSGLSG